MTERFDIAIIGSGFGGSLLSWILAKAGKRVVLLDKTKHPRFAIGESSTPLADILLERIADEYGLAKLKPMARWGSWQREMPEVRSGKKRGFSYFRHHAGKSFNESAAHDASLLVAASATDEQSDTHWMRSDVDHWLCGQAASAGVSVWEASQIQQIARRVNDWHLIGVDGNGSREIFCGKIIDASGSGSVLSRAVANPDISERLNTRTSAVFGHFRGVGSMTEWLRSSGHSVGGDPFDGDDAAQHHLLDDGWMWMLRFGDGTTSAGLVRPTSLLQKVSTMQKQSRASSGNAQRPLCEDRLCKDWINTLAEYPTLAELFHDAELIAPAHEGHVRLGTIPRISRLSSRAAGEGWAMLPTTAGIVDPLHSTGIAHTLHGVRRLARMLLDESRDDTVSYAQYSQETIAEVLWIDRIVQCCYRAAAIHFDVFAATCSLYFVAAIHSERQLATAGEMADGFLLNHSTELSQVVQWCATALQRLAIAGPPDKSRRAHECAAFIAGLRTRLERWNDVGLMDPSLNNRIARSIAPKGPAFSAS